MASNPQENSVLLNKSAFSSQGNVTQPHVYSNYGGNDDSVNDSQNDINSGKIQLSQEYIRARKMMMRS